MKARFVSESIRFERGKDPKEELNIGRDRKIQKGDKIEVEYKGEKYIVTAATDEEEYKGRVQTLGGPGSYREPEYESRTFKEIYVFDKEGNKIKAEAKEWWDNEGNTIWPWEISEWDKPVLESVNFERGKDPKEALNIGKDRKWRIGDKLKLYNAFEDDYWDAEIVYANYEDETGEPYVDAAIIGEGEIWPITFNEEFNEWMIDE